MGLCSSTQKTDTTSNSTTTPTNPQWVTDALSGTSNQLSGLQGQDPKSFFAGPSSLENSLFGYAGTAGQSGMDALNSASGLLKYATGAAPNLASFNPATAAGYNPASMSAAQIAPTTQAQAASAAPGIGTYLNPFESSVAGTTLQQMGQALGIAQNANGQNAQLAGGYGGSRQGVAEGLTNNQFFNDVGNTLSNLNLAGWNSAVGAANNDADRAQQTSLANAAADNQRSLAQAQFGQQASAANQSADNTAWAQNAAAAQQAALANSALGTQNSQFNAGQQDSALQRALQGSQLFSALGQYGLGLLGNTSQIQQALNQQQASAPLTVGTALAGAQAGLPYGLFHGQTVNGQTNSTQTTTPSLMQQIANGGLLGSLLGGGSGAMSFAAPASVDLLPSALSSGAPSLAGSLDTSLPMLAL